MFENIQFADLSGHKYNFISFKEILSKYESENFNIYIGTDSKVIKDNIYLATAICFHKEGLSGKIFLIKDKVSRKKHNSLRSRMLLEAYKSLEVAIEIDQIYTGYLEIHLDIGSTIKSKTSAYEKELTNLIVGQGYSCVIKPDSWASSSCSDHFLKKLWLISNN